jgi:hypothetical protein
MKIIYTFMICVTYHCNQSNSIVTIFTIYKNLKKYKKKSVIRRRFFCRKFTGVMILEKKISSKNRRREFSIPEQEDPNACNIISTFCLNERKINIYKKRCII